MWQPTGLVSPVGPPFRSAPNRDTAFCLPPLPVWGIVRKLNWTTFGVKETLIAQRCRDYEKLSLKVRFSHNALEAPTSFQPLTAYRLRIPGAQECKLPDELLLGATDVDPYQACIDKLRDVPTALGPCSKLDRFVEVADKITEAVQAYSASSGKVRQRLQIRS